MLGLFGLPFRGRTIPAKGGGGRPVPPAPFSALGVLGLPFPARTIAAKGGARPAGAFSALGRFGLPFPARVVAPKPVPPLANWQPPPPAAAAQFLGRWKW